MFVSLVPRKEIQPLNTKPKGYMAFMMWVLLIVGIPSFFFGGFVLVLIASLNLFWLPKKVEKDLPVSFVLDEDRLCCFTYGGKESWSVPWEDIDGIYLVMIHWSCPKNLGIRLKHGENFRASFERPRPGKFWKLYSKLSFSKTAMKVNRLFSKYDVMLTYNLFDRSAEDFAELLSLYMQNNSFKRRSRLRPAQDETLRTADVH